MTALLPRSERHDRPLADPRPLTRSPIHALTLATGVMVVAVGWAAATLLDRTILGLSNDLEGVRELLPSWAQSAAGYASALGTIAVIVGAHAWLLATRRHRELAVAYAGALVAAASSILIGAALESVLDPALLDVTRDPSLSARGAPTDPGVAAVFAILVLSRRWITPRARTLIYLVLPFWLLAGSLVEPDAPYAGLLVDVGIGMAAGSAAGLVLRTPSIRPRADQIRDALTQIGLPVVDLVPAAVDARGSTPYFATTADGRRLFVKALSTEQRSADLLFRAARWIRLRRSGDAPPETSLKRAAEHEAFVSHHVRALGIPTPTLLALADLGDDNVALAYEAIDGRSLDRVDPTEVGDHQLVGLWADVGRMREHGVAHRDLRLANLFLADEPRIFLIDFGFAEVAASDQLLDTDAAELLAALASWVGVSRAVRTAIAGTGVAAVVAACEWLHPLALSNATRTAVGRSGLLDELRDEIRDVAGHHAPEPDPVRRFVAPRVVGAGFTAVALASLVAALAHDDTIDRVVEADGGQIAAAALLGAAAPLAAAIALRSAMAGRLSLRSATASVLIGLLPVGAPTPWSWSAEAAATSSSEARNAASRRAAALWATVGIFTSSIVVGGIAASGLRATYGSLAATGLGAAIGGAVVVTQLALIRSTPWGRALDAEWLRLFDHSALAAAPGRAAAVAGWWSLHAVLMGVSLLLVARAFGVGSPAEHLLAVGIIAPTIASLSPARGGLGATEALLYLGLALDATFADAALVVVTARAVTGWLVLPIGFLVWWRRTAHLDTRAAGQT